MFITAVTNIPSRCMLRGVNFVFMITGIITLVVGIHVCSAFSHYDLLLSNTLLAQPKFIIVTGVCTLISAVVGSFAMRKQEHILKDLYLKAMVVIFVFHLLTCILGFTVKYYELTYVWDQLRASMSAYRHDAAAVRVLDDVQRNFQCCGPSSSYEWVEYLGTQETNGVPISCCDTYGVIHSTQCTTLTAYVSACGHKFGNFVADGMKMMGYTALILTIVQGILVLLTTLAVRKAKQERQAEDENDMLTWGIKPPLQ